MSEPLALIPDPTNGGIVVVDVNMLLAYLADGVSMQEAVDNAGIDSPMTSDPTWSRSVDQYAERIRIHNNGGDYWRLDEPDGAS